MKLDRLDPSGVLGLCNFFKIFKFYLIRNSKDKGVKWMTYVNNNYTPYTVSELRSF